jgi:hypothetical protein
VQDSGITILGDFNLMLGIQGSGAVGAKKPACHQSGRVEQYAAILGTVP